MVKNYKFLFHKMRWGLCYLDEKPWERVSFDCDSMIFRYILDFVEQIGVDKSIVGANLYSTDKIVDKVISKVAGYCEGRLKSDLDNIAKREIECIPVIGKGHIEEKSNTIQNYKEDREILIQELRSLKISIGLELIPVTISLMNKLMINSRDQIRDLIRDTSNIPFRVFSEPDMLCPRICENVVTEDYDLMLFGASTMIKGIEDTTVRFLTRDLVLEHLGLENRSELIRSSIPLGTDYNEKGVLVNQKMIEFFMNPSYVRDVQG